MTSALRLIVAELLVTPIRNLPFPGCGDDGDAIIWQNRDQQPRCAAAATESGAQGRVSRRIWRTVNQLKIEINVGKSLLLVYQNACRSVVGAAGRGTLDR
jgi:hypothetical protein